jgi:putative FmdB family regulatory protein
MPLYDFRCPQCGLEFEVSRPISRATEPVMCPQDNVAAERVFTMPMTFVKGSPGEIPPPPPPSGAQGETGSGFYHGHSHGPGTHTH